MSGSQDIEDVLSSIRRLVSEEVDASAGGVAHGGMPSGSRDGAGAPAEATDEPARGSDRLVLGPSLRVTDPEDPFQTVRGAPAADPRNGAESPASPEGRGGFGADAPPGREPPLLLPPTARAWDAESKADLRSGAGRDYRIDDFDGTHEDVEGLAAAFGRDQDALRALIADVVREELAGPLGERITRNVRKLVRREIRQVLGDRKLD